MQFSEQGSKDELLGGKLKEDHHLGLLHVFEDDCNEEFLEELYCDKLKRDRHLRLLHISEDDCSSDFLEKEGFFGRFEEDGAFEWFFHPDYFFCSSLEDYQRLDLKNYVSYLLTDE
jgi:hypothetical protein